MSDGNLAPIADGAESHAVDRRTLLVGAAGALAAAALSAPARAAGSATCTSWTGRTTTPLWRAGTRTRCSNWSDGSLVRAQGRTTRSSVCIASGSQPRAWSCPGTEVAAGLGVSR